MSTSPDRERKGLAQTECWGVIDINFERYTVVAEDPAWMAGVGDCSGQKCHGRLCHRDLNSDTVTHPCNVNSSRSRRGSVFHVRMVP